MKVLKSIYFDFLLPVFQVFRHYGSVYRYYILFLIIPVIFLLNSSALHLNLGRIFMGNTDPEYFYLYSGIMIGAGNLSVHYTSNPGTPLMFVVGAAARFIDLFHPGDFFEDVVNDPEKYIRAGHLLMIFLIALGLLTGGYYIRKKSGSWFAGVLFQLGVLGCAPLFFITGRLNAEAMMVFPVLLFSIPVFRYLYSEEDKETVSGKTIILFGVIAGFGTAVKISFAPLLLVPMILLKTGFMKKLKLVGYSLVSFAVFAYPVVFNNGDFWHWLFNVVSHTGKYGEGQKGFVDFSTFPYHFDQLYRNDRSFVYIFLFSLIVGLVLYLISFRRKQDDIHSRLSLAVFGWAAGISVSMLLVMKHFELYYFAPFYVSKFLFISLFYLMIINSRIFLKSHLARLPVMIFFTGLAVILVMGSVKRMEQINKHYIARKEIQDREYGKVMNAFEAGSPVIIAGRYYGTPFIEFAHYDGFKMTGHLHKSLIPYLQKKYPVSYQYVPWSEYFYYWGSFVDFSKILENNSRAFFLFVGEKNQESLQVIESRLWQVVPQEKISRQVVYTNEKNGDLLIKYTQLK